MAGGYYNHYDDPDEFWDDEPLRPTPKSPSVGSYHQPVAQPRSYNPSPPQHFASAPKSADTNHLLSGQQPEPAGPKPDLTSEVHAHNLPGSSFATIEVDRGLLPTQVQLSRQWTRYVNPAEAGDELMRAYQKAVAVHVGQSIKSGKLLTGEFRHACPVPDMRTVTILLLEARSWADYRETQTRIFTRGTFEVHGRALIDNRPVVSMTADCFQVKSIYIWSGWARQADPMKIVDEVLFCADRVRELRPTFHVRGDYSRYSDEDLEFQHLRHRDNLIEELGV